MLILISPYSARLVPSGLASPKNYPHWNRLVELLNRDGYEIVQIGVKGEERIEGVGQFVQGWPFDKLVQLTNDCATWISVDNFFPHFANYYRLQPGIVLFGPSDPRIFGYPQNINLLRGRDFLRPYQYASWSEWHPDPKAFVYAENVMGSIYKLAPLPLHEQKQRMVAYA